MARVLLVEDDLDTGESLKAMLDLIGHEVHWAHHGREAVALLQGHPALPERHTIEVAKK